MVGERVFTGVLGYCGAVVYIPSDDLDKSQSESDKAIHAIRSHQLRERDALHRGVASAPSVATAQQDSSNSTEQFRPEVRWFPISWAGTPFALLGSTPVMQRLTDAQMIAVAQQFSMKPRAICGEIAAAASKAADNHDAQCTAVAIFFRPSKATEDAVKAAEAF